LIRFLHWDLLAGWCEKLGVEVLRLVLMVEKFGDVLIVLNCRYCLRVVLISEVWDVLNALDVRKLGD
jgi:hypothetical protein